LHPWLDKVLMEPKHFPSSLYYK